MGKLVMVVVDGFLLKSLAASASDTYWPSQPSHPIQNKPRKSRGKGLTEISTPPSTRSAWMDMNSLCLGQFQQVFTDVLATQLLPLNIATFLSLKLHKSGSTLYTGDDASCQNLIDYYIDNNISHESLVN